MSDIACACTDCKYCFEGECMHISVAIGPDGQCQTIEK